MSGALYTLPGILSRPHCAGCDAQIKKNLKCACGLIWSHGHQGEPAPIDYDDTDALLEELLGAPAAPLRRGRHDYTI